MERGPAAEDRGETAKGRGTVQAAAVATIRRVALEGSCAACAAAAVDRTRADIQPADRDAGRPDAEAWRVPGRTKPRRGAVRGTVGQTDAAREHRGHRGDGDLVHVRGRVTDHHHRHPVPVGEHLRVRRHLLSARQVAGARASVQQPVPVRRREHQPHVRRRRRWWPQRRRRRVREDRRRGGQRALQVQQEPGVRFGGRGQRQARGDRWQAAGQVGGDIEAEEQQHDDHGPSRAGQGMDKHRDHTEVLAEDPSAAAQGGEEKTIGVRRGPADDDDGRGESHHHHYGGRSRRESRREAEKQSTLVDRAIPTNPNVGRR